MLTSKLKHLFESRKRALCERFCKLRTMKRFAFTASIAFVVLGIISAFTGHFGSAASAAPVLLGDPKTLPFVIGGACPNGGIIDPIVSPFCNATGDWLTNGRTYAQHFFEVLVVIEMAWSAILWVFQKEQLGELLASYILKLMGIMFFFMLILNAEVWLPYILQSFAQLGGVVTNNPTVQLDPDVILNEGLAICRAIFQYLPQPHWDTDTGFFGSGISQLLQTDITIAFSLLVAFVFACIICFVVFIAFLIVAGQLIMTLVEIYIMIGAGAVMLGFTGSRWTMSFGEKYIGYCLSMGVKLFVTYVILALGISLFAIFPGNGTCVGSIGNSVCQDLTVINGIDLSDINNLGNLALADLSIGATAVIFMMLAMRLPGLAASMMNGSPSLTLSSAVSAFQTAAGAITGTASALVSIPQTMVQEGGLAVMDAAMLAAGAGAGGGGAAGGGAAAGGSGGGAAASSSSGMSSSMSGGGGGGMDAISQVGGGESGGGGGESGGGSGMPDLSKGLQSVPVAGHLANAAMAPISGGMAAAQAALSPLLNMDEGGGGGSVAIGLKLPE